MVLCTAHAVMEHSFSGAWLTCPQRSSLRPVDRVKCCRTASGRAPTKKRGAQARATHFDRRAFVGQSGRSRDVHTEHPHTHSNNTANLECGVPSRLNECADWYFRVYVGVRLLRRESSTRGWAVGCPPVGLRVKREGKLREVGTGRSLTAKKKTKKETAPLRLCCEAAGIDGSWRVTDGGWEGNRRW